MVKRGILPTPTPPAAKLKLKGVLPGTRNLYGPKLVKIEIYQKQNQEFYIYEADIQEDCLLGLNFLQQFFCEIDPVANKMRINHHYGDVVKLRNSSDSPSVRFTTGSLYFTIRCSYVLDLQPHESVTLNFDFHADCDLSIVPSDTSGTSFPSRHFHDSPWRDGDAVS